MKSRILTCTTAMVVLAGLGGPVRLAAQDQPQPHKKQIYYVVKDLGTLGGTQGVAEGISDRGWVVGDANLAGDQSVHATLWRDGVVTDLGTLGGINSQEQWPVKDNRGLIVGAAETSNMDPFNEDFCGFDANSGVPPTGLICVGFLWQEGVMSALPTLGGNNAQAWAVNNLGQVAGLAEQSTQNQGCIAPQVLDIQAVVWGPKPGEIQVLPPLAGDVSAWAIGINDHQQAVGLSGGCFSPNFNAGGGTPQHGVIWQNGTVTSLGNIPLGPYIFPWAINNLGQVVGQAGTTSQFHTFLWQKGIITDLGVIPGDVLGGAFGLNDQGEIVGGSCGPNVTLEFGCRAYVWRYGVMYDLNALVKPGSTPLYLVFGNDINSRGEIAAYAFDQSNGEFHAALAIPCDEQHTDEQGCKDRTDGATAVRETSGRANVVMSENVREQLWKRIGFRRFRTGLAKQ